MYEKMRLLNSFTDTYRTNTYISWTTVRYTQINLSSRRNTDICNSILRSKSRGSFTRWSVEAKKQRTWAHDMERSYKTEGVAHTRNPVPASKLPTVIGLSDYGSIPCCTLWIQCWPICKSGSTVICHCPPAFNSSAKPQLSTCLLLEIRWETFPPLWPHYTWIQR